MRTTWFERLAPGAFGAVFASGLAITLIVGLVHLAGQLRAVMP